MYVTVEGIDGAGKSSVADALHEHYGGLFTVLTKAPGGTALGTRLRHMLLHSDLDPCVDAQDLLFAADYRQLVHNVIRPSLEADYSIIQDRGIGSAIAYGLARRGWMYADRQRLTSLYADVPMADTVVYLDITVDTCFSRMSSTPDNVERSGPKFFEQVLSHFRNMAMIDRTWVTVDGEQPLDDVIADVLRVIPT